MHRVSILGGVALALLLAPGAALGQAGAAGPSEEPTPLEDPETEEARALFAEGLALADRNEWTHAVQRFRAALEHREAAPVRFNLAISLARMGRLVEALEELDRVLASEDADEDVRRESTLLREEIAPRLGRLMVGVEGGAQGAHVTVDGRPWATLGIFAPADPGVRVVRLVEGNEELDIEETDVPEGGEAEVRLEHPLPAPVEAAPEEGSDDSWIWGTVVGVVIVAVGAAIVTGVVLAEP